MLKLNKEAAITKINDAGKHGQPFFILADFSGENFEFWNVAELQEQKILIDFPNFKNFQFKQQLIKSTKISLAEPLPVKEYKKSFEKVKAYLQQGDSYLCNLTFAQKILLECELIDIFHQSSAKYKIYYPDKFVCFSPEIFVEIEGDKILTYPMKGTFNSKIPEVLDVEKELAEHATVVDLLRNDLTLVANEVLVENYRFVEELHSDSGESYLQTSSQISGHLPKDWRSKLGEILIKLLPAGSVTGAPKKKTLAIIQEIENYHRNFYTGVAGYFDGNNFTSCVLIRFIEKIGNDYYFKTGGGITADSHMESEYQELISKIYVPVSGKH